MVCKVVTNTCSKGGVGKTTYNFHLACKLAEMGNKVLVVDLESPSGINTFLYGDVNELQPSADNVLNLFFVSGYKPVISETSLDVDIIANGGDLDRLDALGVQGLFCFQENIKSLSNDYDYIIIDTPPTMGVRLECALITADVVFTPLEPDKLCINMFYPFLDKYKLLRERMNKRLPMSPYVFFNMVRGSDVEHRPLINKFNSFYPQQYNLLNDVFLSSPISQAVGKLTPIWRYKKGRKARKELNDLLDKMITIIGDK